MIGVEGQYVMIISIKDKTDFIKEEDLVHFTCIEKAGGQLPEFQMEFAIHDPEILGYLNEKNDLIIQYGKTRDTLVHTMWRIGYPALAPAGDEAYRVTLKGTLSNRGYVNNPQTGIYKGTSEKVIGDRASACGFEFDAKTSAADEMNWIQPGVTDWEFIQNTYVRYYGTGDSCAVIAVTRDSKFRYYDLKKHVNSKRSDPDWTLHTSVESMTPKDMVPADGVTVLAGNQFLNQWAGVGRTLIEESIVTGQSTVIETTVPPTETMFGSAGLESQQPNLDDSVDKRMSAVEILIDDNVHKFWNQAYLDNLARLSRSSSVKINFSFDNDFRDAHALDVVNYIAKEIKTDGSQSASKFSAMYAGLYVIETASFRYSNRRVTQSFSMTRDSNADQK